MTTPFEYAKSINSKTGRVEVDKDFNQFVINTLYSNTQDSVFYANESNMFTSNMNNQMVYDFFYFGLPKASRYGKWFKKEKNNQTELEDYVMEYFTCSRAKAVEFIKDFDNENIYIFIDCFDSLIIKVFNKDIDILNNSVSKKIKC